MPTFDFYCKRCDVYKHDSFFMPGEEHIQPCIMCDGDMEKLPSLFSTPEYGGPRYSVAADQTFSSRSEEKAYWKANGFTEAGDKVGGARNEDHLNLGKVFSGKGLTKRGNNPLSK